MRCLFCGKNNTTIDDHGTGQYMIQCPDCGTCTSFIQDPSEDEAIKRYESAVVCKELKALKNDIEFLYQSDYHDIEYKGGYGASEYFCELCNKKKCTELSEACGFEWRGI